MYFSTSALHLLQQLLAEHRRHETKKIRLTVLLSKMLLIEAVMQHNKINKRDLHAFTTLHSNHVLTCNTEFSVFGTDFKRILNQELTINFFA